MTDTTAILGLPYLLPSQAQKHVTHNEALRQLDALVQLSAAEIGADTPLADPAEGDLYILGTAPTGSWAGQAGALALWEGSAWAFIAPREGWRAWDRAAGALRVWTGADWAAIGGGAAIEPPEVLPKLGIATGADDTNRLSVQSAAALFTHDGAGHQVKVNKATTGDTASLLFQSGYTGHAEMGLAARQTSNPANQRAWIGTRTGATGALTWQELFQPGSVVGPVSHSGGVPTGAVVESGSNANGSYVRWADGTQICTNRNAAITTDPAAFTGPVTSIDGDKLRIGRWF